MDVPQSPTRLVSVPVGVGHSIPTEPLEGPRTALIVEADPERLSRAPKQQAVGESLLEPSQPRENALVRDGTGLGSKLEELGALQNLLVMGTRAAWCASQDFLASSKVSRSSPTQ